MWSARERDGAIIKISHKSRGVLGESIKQRKWEAVITLGVRLGELTLLKKCAVSGEMETYSREKQNPFVTHGNEKTMAM